MSRSGSGGAPGRSTATVRLENLTKVYRMGGVRKVVADNLTLSFPPGKAVALLGRNGAGKSTLLQMIAGTTPPDSGRVVCEGTVSWPVGFAGSFHGDLTGVQNVRFVARVYGVDSDGLVEFVTAFSELGPHLRLPIRTYSSGMKARLAFAVSMGIKFDTYLVDEVTSVGDASFREKSETALNERMGASGAIVVSHSLAMLKRLCDSGAVLENGQLLWFDEIAEAIEHHRSNMKAARN